MKKHIARQALHVANVPKHICDHLIGKDHTTYHRMATGVLVMATGVGIAKIPASLEALRFACDMGGYLIHGLGCTPFIDALIQSINKVDHESNPDEIP